MSAKASGSFTIATAKGSVTDIGKNYCRILQRADGYGYTQKKGGAAFPPAARSMGDPP
jgi:cobalamin-dependent methionine synthase I